MSTQTLDALASVASRDDDVNIRTLGSTPRIELWSPWGNSSRPSTAAEETAFIARLRRLALDQRDGGRVPYARHHITALITGLRNAVQADDLLAKAPGLRAPVLVAAYDAVEASRREAARAWQMLVATPTADMLEDVGPLAAGLLPVVISRLNALRLRRPADAPVLGRVVARINDEIRGTQCRALELEAMMQAEPENSSASARVAELLYDGCGDGIWSDGTFLAPRVGTLIPARVASLLDENSVAGGRVRERERPFDAVA
jgi:hypothetical protein